MSVRILHSDYMVNIAVPKEKDMLLAQNCSNKSPGVGCRSGCNGMGGLDNGLEFIAHATITFLRAGFHQVEQPDPRGRCESTSLGARLHGMA